MKVFRTRWSGPRADRVARRAIGALAAALLPIVSPLPAYAEPGFELDAITVTASRMAEPSSASPPAVSVVSAAEMAARGATTVAEALRIAPGLAVSDKGPEGSQASVSIRGSTTNQVLVLLDGVRVNDALSGLVDLSLIPLERVERIEVMRGGGSSLYGTDAVGGVVNIVTRKKGFPLSLSLENGSYLPTARVSGFGFGKAATAPDAAGLVDSQKARLAWGPSLGEAVLRLGAGVSRAANAYTFIDANGERRERQNAGFLGADASIGASLALGPGALSADLSGSLGEKGVPGPEGSPTPRAREGDATAKAVVKYSAERFLSDILSLDASARVDYSRIEYADDADPAKDGSHGILTAGIDVAQSAYPSDGLTLTYGGSLAHATASSDSVGSPERVSAGVFVGPSFGLGALSLRPSVRFDYNSDFFANDPLGGLGAALGAALRASATDTLKASVSRAYRVPTFNDLYWPSSAGAEGDPGLRPETAYEADAGYERREGSYRYVATAFIRYARDVILWQPGGDEVWRPSNYGAALYPGIEQELEARVGERYAVSVNYSFLHSYALSGGLSLSDDRRLPMTPEHSLKGSLSYEGARLSWSATAAYASLRYLKTANAAYLPAYFRLDALARWKASASASIYLACDNLFDERYEIVDGYPMPGTRIRIGADLKL